ncbi:MAG: hypothetical protein D6757_10820 [Alphaproteobacteria bacterium]|nr:MAG: hypothetical protein D6757_10820 [Alphaproteobacteria bacterium]
MGVQPKSIQSETAQSLLAQQLIRHLGFDAAEQTCRENGWDGILEEVRRRRALIHAPAHS